MSSARNVNEAPIGAHAAATASATLMRQTRPTAAAAAIAAYTRSDSQALGTWTKMIRYASPCW